MIVVSDTSPITYLIKINLIHLLPSLFGHVIIPKFVHEELSKVAEQKLWLESDDSDWLVVKEVLDTSSVKRFNLILDRGESEAIALAIELNASALLIDEREGRRIAVEEGLNVTGVIGVLIEAKRQGYIQLIKPPLDSMMSKGFRISTAIYNSVLHQSGE